MTDVAKIMIAVIVALIGVYVAGYLMFIGGIVDVIEQIRAETINSLAIAFGIAKVVFAGFVFTIFLQISIFIGSSY